MVSLPAQDGSAKKAKAKGGNKRPDGQVLECFWQLAELQQNNRVNAAAKLVNQAGSSVYVQERLVKGLLSSRAAARVGYALALSHLPLTDYSALLQRADTVYKEEENESSVALANVFLCASLLRNGSVNQDAPAVRALCERLSGVRDEQPRLGHTVVAVLVSLLPQLESAVYTSAVLPVVQEPLDKLHKTPDADLLWLLLALHHKIPDAVSGNKLLGKLAKQDKLLSFVTANQAVVLPEDRVVVHPVCAWLLFWCNWQQPASVAPLWAECFEPWTVGSAVTKWNVAGAHILTDYIALLQKHEIAEPQLNAFFTAPLLQKVQSALIDRSTVGFTGDAYRTLIQAISGALNKLNADTLLQMMISLNLHAPTFDRVTNCHLQEHVVKALPAATAADVLKQLMAKNESLTDADGDVSQNSVLDQLQWVHSKADAQHRLAILKHLADQALPATQSGGTEGPAATSRRCAVRLNQLLRAQYQEGNKAARFRRYRLTDDQRNVNVQLVKYVIKLRPVQNENHVKLLGDCVRALTADDTASVALAPVLSAACVTWFLSPQDDYIELIEELLDLRSKATKQQQQSKSTTAEDDWLACLVDCLLSVLSREADPLLRATVPYVLCGLAGQCSLQHIQPLIDAVNVAKDSTMVQSDEDDAAAAQSDDEDSEPEEEEEERADDVNENLIEAVRAALGNAIDSDTQEDKSSDMDDDTMLRLDDQLAAAFKTHMQHKQTTNAKGAKKQGAVEGQEIAFRGRVADVLDALVGQDVLSQPVAVLCVAELLAAANQCVHSKAHARLLHKLELTIRHWTQHNPSTPCDDASVYERAFDSAVASACSTSNPGLQQLAGHVLAALLRLSQRLPANDVTQALVAKYTQLIQTYFEDDKQRAVPPELILLAITHHTACLLPCIPTISACAFDTERGLRPFKQSQALRWLAVFVRPALVDFRHKPHKSLWKQLLLELDRFFAAAVEQLRQLATTPAAKDDTSSAADQLFVRPQLLANLFALTVAAIKHCHPLKPMPTLSDRTWVTAHLNVLSEQTAWHKLPKHGQISSVFSQAVGKKPWSCCAFMLKQLESTTEADKTEEVPAAAELSVAEPTSSKKKRRKSSGVSEAD